jgi:excisionase family DNA binding protein
MTSDLLDIEEAAGFLHVKTCTVRSWILKKKLAYVKLGRRVFLRRQDLLDMIDRSLVPADGQANKGSTPCR